MKIGIDARIYGPKQTGIGNYVKYLIEHLARIDKKNEYVIFLKKEDFASYAPPSFRHKKILAPYSWYSFQEQTCFLKTILDHRLDLFHFPHFNVPLFYNKPFIASIHDLTPMFIRQTSFLRKRAYDFVLSHAIKKSRAIITPTRAVKNDILANFSVTSEKIHVIPEGIPLKNSIAPKCPTLNPKPYILYVGVWREHKNLKGLIDAFKQLKNEGHNLRLVIVGEGGIYKDELMSYWTKLGLVKDITPVGFVDDQDLYGYYKNASLVVLPSFFEGFGLVPLEALNAGTPVAVSGIPALKEVLGGAAFFFDPHNVFDMTHTIKTALLNKDARKKKLEYAKNILTRYSWKENARKTLELYKKRAASP